MQNLHQTPLRRACLYRRCSVLVLAKKQSELNTYNNLAALGILQTSVKVWWEHFTREQYQKSLDDAADCLVSLCVVSECGHYRQNRSHQGFSYFQAYYTIMSIHMGCNL